MGSYELDTESSVVKEAASLNNGYYVYVTIKIPEKNQDISLLSLKLAADHLSNVRYVCGGREDLGQNKKPQTLKKSMAFILLSLLGLKTRAKGKYIAPTALKSHPHLSLIFSQLF